MQAFSGGPVVKSLPANAEDMGSILGPGGFHMPPKLLSPCATTTEAYGPWSLCSETREATAMRSPHMPTRE